MFAVKLKIFDAQKEVLQVHGEAEKNVYVRVFSSAVALCCEKNFVGNFDARDKS